MITNATHAGLAIAKVLEKTLRRATKLWDDDGAFSPNLSRELVTHLDYMHENSKQASTAFTNIITSIAIKVAFPEIDIRYHQEQIQDRVKGGAGFSFRTISEGVVYPWLSRKSFDGAKSGWQTRTYERDDPYKLDYPHKIGGAKSPLKGHFLAIYDCIQVGQEDPEEALCYMLFRQVQKRHSSSVNYANPRTDDIERIVDIFARHFSFKYRSKGASRLPVLAIYAIYELIVVELKRYQAASLRPLGAHSAADSRTGAVGDIEVELSSSTLLEALEIKHNIRVTDQIIASAESKIKLSDVKRYYILTTHSECAPDELAKSRIARIANVYECTVIVNGVYATLRYYLRLLERPHDIFAKYTSLLDDDSAIGHEHRVAWNTVVDQTGGRPE